MTEDPRFQNAVIQTAGGYDQITNGKGALVTGYNFGQPPKSPVTPVVTQPVAPPVVAPTPPTIIPSTIIQQQGILQTGDQGLPVANLQMKLNAMNLSIDLKTDGYYGNNTKKQLKNINDPEIYSFQE